MKVSLNLVKKYIDLSNLTNEEIAHRLTFAGVEVESIETLASATNLVIGEVLTCENMPDSDHLHLCTVNAGPKYGVLHIVCGAPNVKAGVKVIVATDGAKLPGGVIKKGKIRGHESEGMLCSLVELGVETKFLKEEQTKGIELLSVGNVGDENVLELLGLDDVIFDLKLLANRSDLYSIYNIAKELETLFDRKATIPTYEKVSGRPLDMEVTSLTKRCPQISIMEVNNIVVKESPDWMKEALRSSGIRSINNIVDIGNYVMLLTGQPLHMYDLDKLPKKELVVRDDISGDFVALDEKTYKLVIGDVSITSNKEVMCLGGVMGSIACAVDENTKNIAIEAANFDFASIRRTSTRLALVSDSSQRFVKGINPNQYNDVMALTLSLLKELCEAKENTEVKTYLEKEYEQVKIPSSVDYINNRLGTSFSKEVILETLKKAHLELKDIKDNSFVAYVPANRIDILTEADLSEEVIRILGFENVISSLPRMTLSVGGLDENLLKKRQVRSYLRGLGLHESLSYSLVKESEINDFRILNKEESYKVMNPITDEREYVRTNLLPSLISQVQYNLNRGNENIALFEVSDLFSIEHNKHIHLAIALAGKDLRQGRINAKDYGYFHLKGIVDGLLNIFGIEEKRVVISYAKEEEFHPGKAAMIKIDNKPLAIFGELNPYTLTKYGFKQNNVALLEMDLDVLFGVKTSMKKMSEVSKFPPVNRDLALVVNKGVTSQEIIREIYKVNRDLIRNVTVFDVYEGEHIKEGYYSLAISILYSSNEKTLQTEEVNALEETIIKNLETKFGVELRK